MNINTFSSVTDMLDALRARQISAVELLDLHLAQIEQHNGDLNAIVTPNYDEARRCAVAADEARARGEEKPLLGLPLTVKDCLYMQGLPTTGGVPELAQAIAEVDSVVVSRLRNAGSVILGKTNVPPYAADWQSDNPLFGRTNNPWNFDHTPGGSTGGGAAAVAAGLTPLEFGGDFGGSIRIPSAFCGVYGHKSSETALPTSGHFPALPLPNASTAMAVQGPLARSAQDLMVAFDVAAGPDIGETVGWQLALPPARHERLADFRVAVLPAVDWLPVDAEIMAAQDTLAEQLRQLGANVEYVQPASFGNLRDYAKLYLSIFYAISTVGTPAEERRRQAQEFRAIGDDLLMAYADALEGSIGDYMMWFGQREFYRAALREFFQEWDILLAPVNIVNAFPHTNAPFPLRQLEVNGEAVGYNLQFVYASLCNLSGHPGTAFPVGVSQNGLPIGLQAIGPYLEDYTSMRFAELVAQEFGGYQRPPNYR
ncbi:MAG: amidase [Chloroflexota bacterium]